MEEQDRSERTDQDDATYVPPEVTPLGSVEELTAGPAPGSIGI